VPILSNIDQSEHPTWQEKKQKQQVVTYPTYELAKP